LQGTPDADREPRGQGLRESGGHDGAHAGQRDLRGARARHHRHRGVDRTALRHAERSPPDCPLLLLPRLARAGHHTRLRLQQESVRRAADRSPADSRPRHRRRPGVRPRGAPHEERDRAPPAQNRVQGQGRGAAAPGPGAARSQKTRDRGRQRRVTEDGHDPEGARLFHEVPGPARTVGPRGRGRLPSARGGMRALRLCVVAAALAACAWALTVRADQSRPQPRRPFRIGVLNAAWAASHPTVEGLKAGLKELGLEDGRDVTFDIRSTAGKLDAMPAAAEALVRSGVDLIFTSQGAATQAAKEATKTVPIVFTLVGDPVAAGLVRAQARPDANVTGVSSLQTELVAKRLQFLKTLAPGVKRVWLIYFGADLSTTPMIGKALDAAPRIKVELLPRGVLDAAQLKQVLREVRRGDAVLAPEGSSLDIPLAILEQSLTLRVPAVFASALWVGHGGLVSYGPDSYAQGIQAASLAAKILRGVKPQDLPVEGADRI